MMEVSFLGLLMALVWYAISVTPSLLPRRWWWHGFVSGILTALGYTFGVGLESFGRFLVEVLQINVDAPPQTVIGVRTAVAVVVALWSGRLIYISARNGRQAARLVEMKPAGIGEYLLGLVATAVVFVVAIGIVQAILWVFSQLVALAALWVPQAFAWLLAATVSVYLIFFISNKVVLKAILAYFAVVAHRLNTVTNRNVPPPTVPQRSGSPDSLCSWESLGGQGRVFLRLGPDQEQIAQVTGRAAKEPVRTYAGMPSGRGDFAALSELAVSELKRAGGFDRAVVLVNTTTGSGWVDEWLVQPLEYLTGGDCATVSIQYSYLYSAALMASDKQPCIDAGVALLEAVESEMQNIPPEKRPLLLVSGESLGAFGSQAAFKDLEDLNSRVDGALWVGSPNASNLLRFFTDRRQQGSPQVVPVVDSGRYVRFVGRSEHLHEDAYGREYGKWEFPRTVFVQHASDPVVWFQGKMVLREPDWMRERAGYDVSPAMTFIPFASLVQVIADLPVAGTAPGGHGHRYHRELIEAWQQVLGFDQALARGGLGESSWVDADMIGLIEEAIEQDLRRGSSSIEK